LERCTSPRSRLSDKKSLRVEELIQVCWDVTEPRTKNREIRTLLKAMDEFRLKRRLVITEDFELEEDFNGKKIKYTPLWKWFLGC